jgi:hypothetical protein
MSFSYAVGFVTRLNEKNWFTDYGQTTNTLGQGSLSVNALHGIRVVFPCDPSAAPGSIGEFAVFFETQSRLEAHGLRVVG